MISQIIICSVKLLEYIRKICYNYYIKNREVFMRKFDMKRAVGGGAIMIN